MSDPSVVSRLLNAQADLQTGLGLLRLEIQQAPIRENRPAHHNITTAERRLTASLAALHALLRDLGTEMA